jgi:hypothetical protein
VTIPSKRRRMIDAHCDEPAIWLHFSLRFLTRTGSGCNGVSDAGAEEGGGGGGTVVPQGEGSLEVKQLDDRAAVESSVELRRSTCASARPLAVP